MSDLWTVLLVDDSDEDRADARRDLLRGSDRRYRFLEAATGAAAVRLCQEFAPAAPTCVVLDYYLPDMDALGVLEALSGPEELVRCPVVLLTGSVGRESGLNAIRAGAMDYLGKRWMNPESLTRAVENAVERHVLLRRRADADACLRENDIRLRLAMDAAGTGMWDWTLANDLVNWSPGCYPIFGVAEGAFAGTADAFSRLVHGDDRDRVWRSVRAAVDRRTRYEAEFRIVRPDGETRWVSNLGRALYDDAGPVRMLGMVTDVTARKTAEQASRERDDRLRYVLRASGTGTWTIDLATGAMECSEECRHIFGVAAGEPFSTFTEQLARVHPDDRAAQAAALGAALAEGREYHTEHRLVWPDGSTRWVLARGQALANDSGVTSRMMGITLDITERKMAETIVRDTARQKDEFIAVLAHELRNPLSPIGAAAALLTGTNPPESDTWRYARVIGRQTAHMSRLLDDLLDVTRLSQGKLTLRPRAVTMQEVLASAVELSRPDIERLGHTLETAGLDEQIAFEADPDRLAQVFGNLLNNAAKYTTRGGRISITVRLDEESVVVSVRDTGIGIAPEMLPRVFDLFAQTDTARQQDGRGLGIGLALTRRLVELHGGRVEAQSDGIGYGSQFTVRLPLSAVPLPANDRPHDTPLSERGRSGQRVLVAEDDRDSVDMLAMLLERAGCQVRTAYDGEAAVREAERFQPDVAFLDLGMPRLSGHEAAQRIRAASWGAGMSLIALTGWGLDEDRRKSAAAGFDEHLVKPVDPDTLFDVLAKVPLRAALKTDTPSIGSQSSGDR